MLWGTYGLIGGVYLKRIQGSISTIRHFIYYSKASKLNALFTEEYFEGKLRVKYFKTNEHFEKPKELNAYDLSPYHSINLRDE